MKKTVISGLDSFAASPMVSLLPVLSQVGNLKDLTSFFYARFEKVTQILKELESRRDSGDMHRNLMLELNMLRQVLDFLEISPQSQE